MAAGVRAPARRTRAPDPAPELAERLLGCFTAYQLTAMRGAANDRARQALDWKPAVPSWRAALADG
ncbi:hypothetical protein RKE29_15505 [Streptomyces sp. B1866]|uniref:hypothetical protein n=1 Tax=Streptomyces sp. B1866 TaxID=3075431 RepID=UPI00288F2C80|nr:hypothetical protein [Streptomyces sp. B1866]MDT3398030.1 hypothetical protein [Streptomyces sp. B1866]